MPQLIINGTAFPIRQEIAFDYDPQNGYIFKQRFAGAGYSEMLRLANQFAAAGIRYEFSYRGGIAYLSAEDSSAQVPIDTWTVAQNEMQKTSLENPRNNALPILEVDILEIAKMQAGEQEYDDVKKFLDNTGGSDESKRLLDRFIKGSTDYASSGYVLRHCTNVGNRYAANVTDYNTDAIYTTSLLLSEAQDSGLWIYPLPGRLVYKLQTLANDFITRYGNRPNYMWGWLKRGSTESTTASNRVNIVTEYWFDQWSTDEYSIAT